VPFTSIIQAHTNKRIRKQKTKHDEVGAQKYFTLIMITTNRQGVKKK
jgi:hypothetical protein